MAGITFLHLLLHIIRCLGFTTIYYDHVKEKFRVKPKSSLQHFYAGFCSVLNFLLVTGFIILRLYLEHKNGAEDLSESIPFLSRPMDIYESILDISYYIIVCLRFRSKQQLTLNIIQELQHVVRTLQRGSDRHWVPIPWQMLVFGWLLLIKTFASVAGEMDIIWTNVEDYGYLVHLWAWLDFLLAGVNAFLQLHWLFYFLYFVLLSNIFEGVNKMFEKNFKNKRLNIYKKWLQLLPKLHGLHLQALRVFSASFLYLHLKICLKLYTFISSFHYNNVTTARQKIIIEEAEENEEDVDHIEQFRLFIPSNFVETLNKVHLILLLATLLGVVYASHLFVRERNQFKYNILSMSVKSESYELPLTRNADTEIQHFHGRSNSTEVDGILNFRQCTLKQCLIDVMFESDIKVDKLVFDDVVVQKTLWIKINSAQAAGNLALTMGSLLFVVLVDAMQRQDILHLEKIMKQHRYIP